MKFIRSSIAIFVFATASFVWGSAALAHPSLSDADRGLIALACHHSIVVLGENSHGDGATITAKVRIIPELVRRCGFSAIVFEASLYDFAQLRRITAPQQFYDREKLISSIGQIWNKDKELEPLVLWLSSQPSRRVAVGGMDEQIGSRGAFYSLTTMLTELAALVTPGERPACLSLLKLIGWEGLDDEAQRERTNHCLSVAITALNQRTDPDANHLRAMAGAFQRANARTRLATDDYVADRDHSMAKNFETFRQSLPRGTKIIVWAANGHAALGGLAIGKTFAQHAREQYGDSMFTVGFSAAGGQFRWTSTEVRDVPPASAVSVERRLLGRRFAAVGSHRQLVKIGIVPGTALSWHKKTTANWSELFDALYVLKDEQPTTAIK